MKKPTHWVPDAGLCMHCNKGSFMTALSKAPNIVGFNYVEIGVFNGNTMRWACDYLSSSRPVWSAFGVEIPEWKPHIPHAKKCLGDYWDGTVIESVDPEKGIYHPFNRVAMFTCGSEAFLKHSGIVPSFVFIDGCHSAKCCASDFILTESIMQPGGIVAIHDIDRSYQGLDPTPHCNEGIGVLKAIKALGLFDKTRPGWTEIDRSPEDYENHGCLFIQKL